MARSARAASEGEPPQTYGSRPIEVAWTVAPVLIVFVLFLIVVRSVAEVRQNDPPPSAVRVTVVGHRWWWEYHYPDLGIVTANELHVPDLTAVATRLTHDELIRQVLQGGGNMPAYGKQLRPAEVEALVVLLETLRPEGTQPARSPVPPPEAARHRKQAR